MSQEDSAHGLRVTTSRIRPWPNTARPLVAQYTSETLDAFVAELRGVFVDGLAGVYLYGSIVWDAYDPAVSDLDVAVLHRSDLKGDQRRALARLHRDFGRRYATAGLDVSFVPLRLVGTYGDDALPYFRDGSFHQSGGGDVNMIMWHTLNERGLVVWGPPAADLVPPVGEEDLAENARRNLAFLSRKMPAYVNSGTEDQVFGVLCLCRSLHTLRTGKITGKASAARWALGEVHPRWRPLVERAVTRYEKGDFSGFDPLFREAGLFAAHLRERRDRSRPSIY